MKGDQPRQPLISGLAVLHAIQQKSVADGKKIFDLVMQEVANAKTLKGIVYQESLFQLILYVLDHRKEVTSRVNQDKSAKQRTVAANAAKSLSKSKHTKLEITGEVGEPVGKAPFTVTVKLDIIYFL